VGLTWRRFFRALIATVAVAAAGGCRRALPTESGTFTIADAAGADRTIPIPGTGGDGGGGFDAPSTQDATAMCPPGAPTFDACGCGCCGPPLSKACYYPELGQSIATVPNPTPTNCNIAGCSAGVHYECCAGPGAPPAAGASTCYTIDKSQNGGYHITLQEGGLCTILHVTAYTGSTFPISVPQGFNASGGLSGVCNGDYAVLAIGGLGSVAISSASDKLDVHVVLFFDRNGTVEAKRIDADQVAYCNG
jgi:hypothetical protein